MIKLEKTIVANSEKGIIKFLLEVETIFHDGQRYLIIGDNGSGKSTLLAAIEGRRCHRGRIVFDGVEEGKKPDVFSSTTAEIPKKIQVKKYLALLGFSPKQIEDVLDLLSLTDYRNTSIGHLSPAEQNRLKLVLLLKHSYPYILVDEITNGLSFVQAKKIIGFLTNNFKDAILIMADHHSEELKECFDQVIYLQNGKISRTENIKKIAAEDQNNYYPTRKSGKNFALRLAFHRVRTGWLTCLVSSVLILIFNLFAFAVFTLSTQTAHTALPCIGLRANNRSAIDLSGGHFADEGLFSEAIFSDERPFIDTDSVSSKRLYLHIAGPFDAYGDRLISGKRPRGIYQAAISKDLKKYLHNNKLELSLSDSHPIRFAIEITGYIRGSQSIYVSEAFYGISAYYNSYEGYKIPDSDKLIFSSRDNFFPCQAVISDKSTFFAPSEECFKSKVDLLDIAVTLPSLGTSTALDLSSGYEIHYDSGLKGISLALPLEKMIALAEILSKENSVILHYRSESNLKKDREMFLARGYEVFSQYPAQTIADKIFLQMVGTVIGSLLMIVLVLGFNRRLQRQEKITDSSLYDKIDRIIFLTLFFLMLLPYLVFSIRFSPPLISWLFSSLMFLSVLIAAIFVKPKVGMRR